MEKLKLGINLSDREYGQALASYIAKYYRFAEVFVGNVPDNVEYVIEDEDVVVPSSAKELMDKIMDKIDIVNNFGISEVNNLFTGFTAGCGGCGVTAAARLYGELKALKGEDCLYISLNPFEKDGRNRLAAMELEELSEFLTGLSTDMRKREVILDIPPSYRHWREVMSMCERQIVVFSWEEGRKPYSEAAAKELELMGSYVTEPGRVYRFSPARDDESFKYEAPDIYGQLGSEVKALEKKLGEDYA